MNTKPEFEEVYDNAALKAAFKAFCATRKIDENFVFIEAVNNYKAQDVDSIRYQLAATIVTTFVRFGAPSEINIQNELREQVMASFVKAISSPNGCTTSLFDTVQAELVLQLKTEHFEKFLTSKYFDQYLKGQSQQYKVYDEQSFNAESQSELFNITDLSKPIVKAEDFAKLASMMKDDEKLWEALVKKPDMVTYKSKQTFKIENKGGIRMFKIVSEYDYGINDTMQTLLSKENRLITDGNLIEQKFIDYIQRDDEHPFAISITWERYKLIWPISDRDMVFCTSIKHEPQHKRYIIMRKTTQHPKCPHQKGIVRGACFGGWILEELSSKRTRINQIVFVDFGGYVPTKLWNMILSRRGDDSYFALLKVLQQEKKKGFPAPVDDSRWYETLMENSMVKKNSSPSTPNMSPSASPYMSRRPSEQLEQQAAAAMLNTIMVPMTPVDDESQ